MYFHFILSCVAIWTWFKSMRTVFGKLKKKSGQAAKANTARQDWTMKSFKFLESHLTIRTDTRQLGKVPQVLEEEEEEEESDDDDASSVRSSSQPPSSSQASSSQASPSHVKDSRNTRPKAPSTAAKSVDEAILQIVDRILSTQSVQYQLAAVVQGGSNDRISWCQWMGLETSNLSEDLWTYFMQESFSMILHFRQLQQ